MRFNIPISSWLLKKCIQQSNGKERAAYYRDENNMEVLWHLLFLSLIASVICIIRLLYGYDGMQIYVPVLVTIFISIASMYLVRLNDGVKVVEKWITILHSYDNAVDVWLTGFITLGGSWSAQLIANWIKIGTFWAARNDY